MRQIYLFKHYLKAEYNLNLLNRRLFKMIVIGCAYINH